MQRPSSHTLLDARLLIVALLGPLLAFLASPTTASDKQSLAQNGYRTLRYDVAMDGTSFHFEGPTNAAGYPADGTPFVVRGYIYPAGTFEQHGSASGTNPDGSPEFPQLVMGTWYCRGWHLQDGDALTGPIVATTQVFDLDSERPGRRTIVTDGIELADFGVPFDRAIVGGTGSYRDPSGRSVQTYVDVNSSFGFNTSFVMRIAR